VIDLAVGAMSMWIVAACIQGLTSLFAGGLRRALNRELLRASFVVGLEAHSRSSSISVVEPETNLRVLPSLAI
jgi:hypothetical protein